MSIQFIKKVTPNKPIRWYVYAYRGGPRIATIESPKKPKLNLEQKRKALEAQEALSNPSNKRLRGLIWEWRRSLAWSEMAQTTRDLWSLELNRIDDKWGDKPVAVWNDIRMKAKVVQWRDSRANTPRQADVGIQALKALLKFGILMGRVRLNVAEDIPQLYKGGGRDEIIWTADDVDRFTKAAIEDGAEHIVDGLRLAAVTGLRRADLVSAERLRFRAPSSWKRFWMTCASAPARMASTMCWSTAGAWRGVEWATAPASTVSATWQKSFTLRRMRMEKT